MSPHTGSRALCPPRRRVTCGNGRARRLYATESLVRSADRSLARALTPRLGFRCGELLQARLDFPLAQASKRCQHRSLFGPRSGRFVLPVVDRLRTHAHEPSEIGGRKAQPFTLRTKSLGDESHAFRIRFDGCCRSQLRLPAREQRHLALELRDLALQCSIPGKDARLGETRFDTWLTQSAASATATKGA